MRSYFKKGLGAMLDYLEPKIVLVYGNMPEDIFGEYHGRATFTRYESEIEKTHKKGGQ